MLHPLPGAPRRQLAGGTPIVVPDETTPYELKVRPPYGKDTVLAVASETPIDITGDPGSLALDARVLRSTIRHRAGGGAAGYAKAEVVVTTGP